MPPNIKWNNILVKNGEASQESMSILIDSKGFVWTGTDNALYRYDGIRYLEYGANTGSNEGFKGYGVLDIFEDSEKNIWIGTSEAINKLDPSKTTFKQYVPDSLNKDGISNFVREIREDRDGLLWILTRRDIFSFDRKEEKFTRYPTDSLSWYNQNSLFTNEDQCFSEDKNGNKWFVTNRGLYMFSGKDKIFRMVLPDPELMDLGNISKVRCVVTDSSGITWIGTEGGGLLKWDTAAGRPEKVAIQPEGKFDETYNTVTTILPDRNKYIWCFGNSAFSIYDRVTGNSKNYVFNYRHRTIIESPSSKVLINQAFSYYDGTIWFVSLTAGLIFRFDPKTERLSLYRTPYFMVYQCTKDSSGSFWFACIRGNIARLETSQVQYMPLQIPNTARVSQEHKQNIIEDKIDRVWFLLNGGTFIYRKFDNQLGIKNEQFYFPGGDTISSRGFSDSQGNLWFMTNRGRIIEYNPLKNSSAYITIPFPSDPESGNLPMISEDKYGNIWIVSPRYGLCKIDKDSGKPGHVLDFRKYNRSMGYAGLYDFLIDSRGDFWISTGDALLIVTMPGMSIIDYTNSGDKTFHLYGSNIRIIEDHKGNIWLLNNHSGVYFFNRPENIFTKVHFSDEGPGSQYYDLLADRTGRLWIAHNRGITIFDPDLKSSRLIKTPMLQFDLQSYQTKSGHILYINHNQLYLFNEDIPSNNVVPPVVLTNLFINGVEYNLIAKKNIDISSLGSVDLTFRQNSLSFEFAALNYRFPERNMYKFFLKGFDRDTTQAGPGLPAEYKNLPPGRYKFWVTGSNNDGIWNSSGVSMNIRIHPPWYRSILSFIIYGIIISSLIAVYIRLRIRHLVREKQRLNSLVNSATAELENKNRQLADMDRIKTHFFTDIAHEIRTPLSLITGPLENLSKEEMLSGRIRETIELVKRNSKRLSHLVNQLLDISKLDSGKMKIILSERDIIKDLKILLYEFLSLSEGRKIKYTIDLPDIQFITWYDNDKTTKILSNLLSNAFKYTPAKGQVLCYIRIDSVPDEKYTHILKITVKDTGYGIESDHLNKIFDRFYRIEGDNEDITHGTGIGLSLVREFVVLLKGKISVNSIPGTGSEFIAEIPMGKDHLTPDEYIVIQPVNEPYEKYTIETRARLQDRFSTEQTGIGKARILIVEDNTDLRNYIRDSLSDSFTVLTAENGIKGIKTATAVIPDLIITDIMMPELDGVKLCQMLKNDDRTSHIPVIMLTAKATSDNKIEGLKTGADDYISKPFDMDELRIRIMNLILSRENLKKKYSKPGFLKIPGDKPVPADERFMAKILQIIKARITNYGFGVEELSEMAGMSKRQLTRKLKAITGLSPGTLIRNVRLEKAAELLIHKTGNVSEIANSVGFSNPSHFTNSFRQYFGVSPKDYPIINSSEQVTVPL